MVFEITKDMTVKEINDALRMSKVRKPFNAKKHSGKVKWNIDGLKYQKQIRDEWAKRDD